MTLLIQQIKINNLANQVLNERQLARVLGGSEARRYGQVNRALKSGELVRVKRGLYVLADELRDNPVHPFALAQQLQPGSYISAESALSYHGWIPESVHSVLSIVAEGKFVSYEHDSLGKFEFRRLPVNTGYFLQSVNRTELQHQVALIAEPMRALLDLVYLRKLPWQGMDYLLDGLRFDKEAMTAVPLVNITQLLKVYKGKRERLFIEELLKSLDRM